MALTRLPLSKWWVETDDATGEITGTYNKASITADIKAIKETLLQYPDLTQDADDVNAMLESVKSVEVWNAARKKRVTTLIENMFQAYQQDPLQHETAQLTSKLNDLIALRERLV